MSAGWIGLALGCWLVVLFLLACLVGRFLGMNDRPSSRPERPSAEDELDELIEREIDRAGRAMLKIARR